MVAPEVIEWIPDRAELRGQGSRLWLPYHDENAGVWRRRWREVVPQRGNGPRVRRDRHNPIEIMLPPPPQPQLTPLIRQRLREKFPKLQDEDLPHFELSERELVERISRKTGRVPERVRRVLYEIGVFVRPRVAVQELRASHATEESLGSGVPDDTGQSGMMGMGPGW